MRAISMLTETIEYAIVSVKMTTAYANSKLIEKWAAEFRGVFSLADLRNLLDPTSDTVLFQRLKSLRALGVIRRFGRSFYVTEGFSLETLSSRICPDSCISFATVLADALVIGSIPANTVTAVKCGPSREYLSDWGNVVHLGLAGHLLFGYTVRDGVRYADKEKAFLDTVYYYQKGRRYSFDPYTDVNIDLLDREQLRRYIGRYRNPGFATFVEGFLNA